MNFTIAIVEDSLNEVNLLKKYFSRYSSEKDVHFTLKHFPDAADFLLRYRPVYDMILMDIGLPKINGMDAAAKLREIDSSVLLIFVTNMAQFAVKGYEVDAFDFMVKPVSYPNFIMKISRALNRLETRQDDLLTISTADTIYRVPFSQIRYIEISGHHLVYHAIDKIINSYGNLKEVEASLNSKVFTRCNSCYLVNLHYIRSIQGNIAIVGNDELQISRPRKKAFIQALNDYLGGGV